MTNRCKFGIGSGKFAQVDMGTVIRAIGWRELPRLEAADGSESEHGKSAPKVFVRKAEQVIVLRRQYSIITEACAGNGAASSVSW
jgi:hypothetical protein